MSSPDPDGRRRDDLLDRATAIAPYYTGEWDPDADDAGGALVRLFAELASEVTERVDRVPEKHRVAFYDTLGFDRRPPQAARLPLSVTVADGVDRNVPIPAGTRTVGGSPEQTFTVLSGDGFEATPAQLLSAYSVAPEDGQIYDHDALLAGEDATAFRGTEGRQEHALHVGHAGQLDVEGSADDPTTIRATLETGVSGAALASRLDWEFYGERGDVEDWHAITSVSAPDADGAGGARRGRPYEALLTNAIRALAAVVRRVADELEPATVGALAEDLVTVLVKLREGLTEEGVQAALRRIADDLDSGPFETAIRTEFGPALRRVAEAFAGGPVERALERDAADAVETLTEQFGEDVDTEPLEEELDRMADTLEAGEATGELLEALEDAIGTARESFDTDVELPEGEPPAIDESPVSALFRALATALDGLRTELAGPALPAVVRALATLIERLDDEFEALREGPVGDTIRATLRPPLDELAAAFAEDPAVRAADAALFDLAGALITGTTGSAVREDLGDAIEGLADAVDAAAGDRDLGSLVRALRELADSLDRSRSEQLAALDSVRRSITERLDPEGDDEDGAGPVARRTIDLSIDGTPTETAVNGTEARWLRCRVPEAEWGSDLLGMHIGRRDTAEEPAPPVQLGPVPEGTVPTDTLLANGTEVSTDDGGFHPLGREPRQQDAFYIGARQAFTKAGATVEIRLGNVTEATVDFSIDPDVAWEYWDGDAWSRLGLRETNPNGVRTLRESGYVRFRVPADLAETSVAGHDGHWVRARLVGGSYGRFEATEQTDSTNDTEEEYWVTTHEVAPPKLDSVEVGYTGEGAVQPAAHLVSLNNLAYGPDFAAGGRSRFRPFAGLPDEEQTLYLGFDRPLANGPINLLFDFEEVQYAAAFHPRVRWERSTTEGRWTGVDVRDGTEGLTERGLVSLTFADPTRATSRFGRERHWLRARVTGTPFTGPASDGSGADGPPERAGPESCGQRVPTEPPAGEPGRERPTVTGVYPNAGMAHNVRRVEDELLGSSDGTQNQTVGAANSPASDVDLWVDELGALSEGQRRALGDSPTPDTEVETGTDGEPSGFWVRWTAVESFRGSDGDDRHYTLDPTSGEISFGDGNRGRIPPRGRDNIRASYRTGGGSSGNLPPGAIAELKSSVPFVDAVTNPLPADGGADAETVGGVLDRAPKELRDRGRAVTGADVERIAMDASRQLARVRCLSGMDRAGDRAPGWVTLLVVPGSSEDKPVPSVSLREQVRRAVSERAPATLVGDPEQLVVRGPSYVAVSVEATLAAAGVGSLARLEETAMGAIETFLHPLSGGPEGEGWGFGEPPCPSDFYTLLEGIDGVDHVGEVVLGFRGTDATVTVREGDATPSMAADTLVHGGSHEIRANRADRSGGA